MKSIFTALVLIAVSNVFSQSTAGEGTYVVVIGVSNYFDAELPDLKYARRDAEAMITFLQSTSGGEIPKENILLLTDAYATGARFNAALDWLAEKSLIAEKLIVFLSGYGDTQIKKGTPAYFLLSDSPVAPFSAGAVWLEEYASLFQSFGVKDFMLICNFYPLPIKSSANEINDFKKEGSSFFKNDFLLNTTTSKDYLPKKDNFDKVNSKSSKITNNHLLIDALLGLADRNGDLEISFKELKRFLRKPNLDHLPGLLYLAVGRRYQPIANIDTVTLKKLSHHGDKFFPSIVHLETGKKEEQILKNLSEEIQLLYRDFIVAVKLGNLLTPIGQSADDFYNLLIEQPILKKLHGDMRRKLAAAMQDEVQQALNAYLELDNRELERRERDLEPYLLYTEYLRRSMELFGSRNFFRKSLEPKLYYFQGLIYRMQALKSNQMELLKKAENAQRSALHIAPGASYIQNELGVVFSLTSNWDSAKVYFQKAIEFSPTWGIPYSNLSIAFSNSGDFEKALNFGIKAFQRSPKNIYITETLGSAYLQSGDLYSAERSYQIVLEKDPNNIHALYDMACIRALTNKQESALFFLQKAFRAGFDDIDHLRGDPDLNSVKETKEYTALMMQFAKE